MISLGYVYLARRSHYLTTKYVVDKVCRIAGKLCFEWNLHLSPKVSMEQHAGDQTLTEGAVS
jgi:hypothetical protein